MRPRLAEQQEIFKREKSERKVIQKEKRFENCDFNDKVGDADRECLFCTEIFSHDERG
jgi:hypothetical protein